MQQYANTVDQLWTVPAAGAANTQYRSAAALFWIAVVLQAGGRFLSVAAQTLDAWLENRRAAAATLHDLGAMTERELLDIGLTRVDVHRLASGAADWYRI